MLRRIMILLNRPDIFTVVFIICGIIFAKLYCEEPVIFFIGSILVFVIPLSIRVTTLRYLKAKEITNTSKYIDKLKLINEILKEYEKLTGISFNVKVVAINEPNLTANIFTSSLYVTKGFLDNMDILTRDEIKAILGHEIGHKIRMGDIILQTAFPPLFSIFMMIVAFFVISFLYVLFWRLLPLYLIFDNIELLLSFIIYVSYYLSFFSVSRYKEYKADEESIKLGNEKHHLVSALRKLEALWVRKEKRYGRILSFLDNLFNTHPRIRDRIKRVNDLQRSHII